MTNTPVAANEQKPASPANPQQSQTNAPKPANKPGQSGQQQK